MGCVGGARVVEYGCAEDLLNVSDADLFRLHGKLLTDNERAVFSLYVRGVSQRTIALGLDLSRSAVQSRLETGRRRMYIAMRKENAPA